jgi:hypothetical protein
MRTSLNEIKLIESYLQDNLSSEARKHFEELMAANALLRLNVFLQRKVFALLKNYLREGLKHKASLVHDKLFHDPREVSFQETIRQIFKS